MSAEKIEDLSIEQLLKRKRFLTFLAGIFIGILLVWIALIVYNFIKEDSGLKSINYGGLATIAGIWLPFYMLGKVNAELKRRKDN